MRKMLVAVGALLSCAVLAGCTGQAQPNATKPTANCFPGVPQVSATTVKPGADITVTGPGADCAVLFTSKSHELQLDLTAGNTVLASTFVKADAHGRYKTKLHVPSSQAPGAARVSLSSGYRFTCDDVRGADSAPSPAPSCVPPVVAVKIVR